MAHNRFLRRYLRWPSVRRHSVWDFARKNCWQWCTGWLQCPLSVAVRGHSEGAEADEFRVDNLWSDTGDASMRKLLLGVIVLGVAVGTAWTFSGAAQKDDDDKKKPKYTIRSEERRVGKEGRSRRWPYH